MSYNSNASPLLKKRCLLWTTSVATRAPQEAGSEDPASNMDLKAENVAGFTLPVRGDQKPG